MTTLVTHFENEFYEIACKHNPEYVHLPVHKDTHLELNEYDELSFSSYIKYNKTIIYRVVATPLKITKAKELYDCFNRPF